MGTEVRRRRRGRTAGHTAPGHPRRSDWAAYGACVWALLFGASNLYWGLGGRLAIPLSDPEAALGDPAFVALNWVAIGLKVGMAALALATIRPWGRVIPRRVLLFTTYGLGVGMAAYGALGLVVDGLRVAGVIGVPRSAWTSLLWHVLLWDPWWIIGGVLFVATARRYRVSSSPSGSPESEGQRDAAGTAPG